MLNKITAFVVNNPRKCIVFIILVSLFFCFFAFRITFNANMKDMIPLDDPAIKDLERAIEIFGSQNFLMVVIKSSDVFKVDLLKKVDYLSEKFSHLRGVERVITPLNITLIESGEFFIEVTPIVEHIPRNEKEVKEFKEKILGSRRGRALISKDEKSLLILITLKPEIIATEGANELVRELMKITKEEEGEDKIYVVGDAYLASYATDRMKYDLYFLFPLVTFTVTLILYLNFRRKLGVFLPLLTVILSVIWTIGLMALVGFSFTIVSVITPVILVAIGSAYGIHIMNKYYEAIRKDISAKEAVLETMREMNSPVIMTAFTTVGGFITLTTSFVIPIKEFGVATAFGVLAAMILSLVLIPAVLVLQNSPPSFREKKSKINLSSFLNKVGKSINKYPRVVIILSGGILVFFALGIPKIITEADLTRYLGERSAVVKGIRFVESEFGGSSRIMVVVDTGEKDGIKNPEVLRKMKDIEDYLDSLPYVSNSSSVATLISEINQVLNGGDPQYYAIPETKKAVAQELLLFTMQGGSEIDSLVSYDFKEALVTAQLENISGEKLRGLIKEIDSYLEENFNEKGFYAKLVGMPKIVIRLMTKIFESQIRSLLTSIVVVSIIVSLLFGSLTMGLLCCLPLILTVVVNFGLMGYLNIPLDVATAMIASVAIGIGVDYSIHFISRYRREVKENKDKKEALINTTQTAGKGIFINAITLIFGFGILLFSSFYGISIFGYLVSLTMLVSCVSSLTIIPAILRVTHIGEK